MVIYHTDGDRAYVTVPTPEFLSLLMGQGLTEMEAIEVARQKDVPKTHSSFIGGRELAPSDRYFRDAWTCDVVNSGIGIDIVKAREIQKKRVLEESELAYDKLNREISKAEDRLDTKTVDDLKLQRKNLLGEIDNIDATLDSIVDDTQLRNYKPVHLSGVAVIEVGEII